MFGWFKPKDSNVADRIRVIEKLAQQLREDLDDLAKKHERLRGRFYAVSPAPVQRDANRSERKASILSRYFVPGRPAAHTSGGEQRSIPEED